jgi:CheY-like chemotaxis protein
MLQGWDTHVVQVIDMMRQRFGDIFRFVLCTALSDAEAEELAKGSNAIGYITKPYNSQEIIEKVHATAAQDIHGASNKEGAALSTVRSLSSEKSGSCSVVPNEESLNPNRFSSRSLQQSCAAAKLVGRHGSHSSLPSIPVATGTAKSTEDMPFDSAVMGDRARQALELLGRSLSGQHSTMSAYVSNAVSAGRSMPSASLHYSKGGRSGGMAEELCRGGVSRADGRGQASSAYLRPKPDVREQSKVYRSTTSPADAPNVAMVVPFYTGATEARPKQQHRTTSTGHETPLTSTPAIDVPASTTWERMHSSIHVPVPYGVELGEHVSCVSSQERQSASMATSAPLSAAANLSVHCSKHNGRLDSCTSSTYDRTVQCIQPRLAESEALQCVGVPAMASQHQLGAAETVKKDLVAQFEEGCDTENLKTIVMPDPSLPSDSPSASGAMRSYFYGTRRLQSFGSTVGSAVGSGQPSGPLVPPFSCMGVHDPSYNPSVAPRHQSYNINRLPNVMQPNRISYERLRDVLNALTEECPSSQQGPMQSHQHGSNQTNLDSRITDCSSPPHDLLGRPTQLKMTHQACGVNAKS